MTKRPQPPKTSPPPLGRRQLLAGLACLALTPHKGWSMSCTPLTPDWRFVADTVMGGVSTGQVSMITTAGREAAQLTGTVSLENNGGFIQMAFNPGGADLFDASAFAGLGFEVRGNGANYDVTLRTGDLTRPWQSYRAAFVTADGWQRVALPWDAFQPNRTEAPLNPARLRRIGIISVGAAMTVDVSVRGLCLIAGT